ncbi:MAG TPA: tripartite tricarboxylate transporter TctB family protein [Burkholderiaceae bacterium]|nr:tripartite tricarboxylate transporter TctB family protein [Burkholderiaceae bacterium]
MKIRNAKDFWSGVMFIAFGLFFAGFARQYDLGTAARMGPAYFPTMLGLLLILIGAAISFKAFRSPDDAHGAVDRFHFKPLVLVLGAVVAFALLLRPGGLIVALLALIIISSLGSGEFRLKEILPLAIGLCLLVLAVFIWGLGLTIPVLPAFLQR